MSPHADYFVIKYPYRVNRLSIKINEYLDAIYHPCIINGTSDASSDHILEDRIQTMQCMRSFA